MTRYVWSDGWHDKATGERMAVAEGPLASPHITPVMPEYQSPIDGRVISTRHERREDLKRNGCVPYEDSMSPTKGKIRNKAFAKKRGLKVSEEFE